MDWTSRFAERARNRGGAELAAILSGPGPGVLAMTGGFPNIATFQTEVLGEIAARVIATDPGVALQYGPSAGLPSVRTYLRSRVASTQGVEPAEDELIVTSGGMECIDLLCRTMLEPGDGVAVEAPTYLGALQAFSAFEPDVVSVDCDDEGPIPAALSQAAGARFLYLLPTFQNPSGRCMGEARRAELARAAEAIGLPLIEDNPYGDLWFDAPPPASLAARWADGTIYLGSFSKVLAPGLRLGYAIAPPRLFPKLLQAKQAADLHTPGFNQRIVHEVIRDGFLRDHVPTIRARYKAQRDAMQQALATHFGADALSGCRWNTPQGGMFFWLELPEGIDATALLPRAVARGVAFVPGAAFHANDTRPNTLRLSFVTVAPDVIARGVAALAAAIGEMA
jgi:2-aminoadipate transaminase